MPTALVAEDEPRLRARLIELLGQLWPDLSIVAECEDGPQALAAMNQHAPDVLFLDIRMPGLSGIDVARAAAGQAHVVFITAYDEYAIEAFERGAIDYVLKPFDEARLEITVDRLKERLGAQPPVLEQLVESLAERLAPRAAQHLRWIKASVGPNVRLIPVEEVLFFQSDEKYTRVVTVEAESLIRKPIRELLAELDPDKFWQIHRATIVNVDHIASVRRGLKDQAEISLRDHPSTLIVSRAYTHLFKQM